MWAPYHVCLKFSFNLGISVKMKKEVFEETIVSGEQMLEKLSVRKKVEGLDRGLDEYRRLDEDEKNVLIPFAMSHHATSRDAAALLRAYSADLDRGVCRESLCIDFIQMAQRTYWLEKCTRMKSDMEALGTVPMAEHGYALTKDPDVETTVDLYRAIEGNLMEIADLIGEVGEKLAKAPLTLYAGYYHHLRAQYDEEQAVKDFRYWQLQSGVPSLVKLKMLRAEKIADFINSGILDLALGSCRTESDDVDVEQFRKQLPHDYACVNNFDILCPIFCRTVSKQGDILVPDYECAGLFIFQHWVELTEKQLHAIFYLDEMLELIHGEIQDLPEAEKDPAPERGGERDPAPADASDVTTVALPEPLATPEAMIIWKKVQAAGYVDEDYQPLISNTLSALLAAEIADRLNIQNRWKPFETFWSRKNMYRKFYDAVNQRQYSDFIKQLKTLF